MKDRMSNWPTLRCLTLRNALRLVLAFTLLQCEMHGQATQSQAGQLAASIVRAKSGSFDTTDLETIARFGAAQQVLPALEEQFAHTTDVETQGIIASALVRLGDKDNTYWNFLLEQATLAVDSNPPDATPLSQGNLLENQPSPEVSAWAQAHHVDYNTAANSAVYELPGKVMLLGRTGDPRGILLLRRALQSHDPMIAVMAAKGLAQIHDNDSIPLIVEACRKAGKILAGGIAESSLIFFDDPRAQSAVDAYVPKERAKIRRDARATGLKPFGY